MVFIKTILNYCMYDWTWKCALAIFASRGEPMNLHKFHKFSALWLLCCLKWRIQTTIRKQQSYPYMPVYGMFSLQWKVNQISLVDLRCPPNSWRILHKLDKRSPQLLTSSQWKVSKVKLFVQKWPIYFLTLSLLWVMTTVENKSLADGTFPAPCFDSMGYVSSFIYSF